MSDTGRLTKRFLTDDEVIGVVDKFGQELTFRVRVYHGARVAPVVLVSPTINDDGRSYAPSCMTCKLANAVLGGILVHRPRSMVYHEADILPDGTPSLDYVSFCFFGSQHRLVAYDPRREPISLSTLEIILGTKIDL